MFLWVFRPGVGCHNALKALMKSANANYDGAIIEIDIRKYFDRVSFDWLENNILMDKVILKKFLRAGYIEKTNLEAKQPKDFLKGHSSRLRLRL